MSFPQWIADRFRRWMHGDQHEDWYRRQIEANDFDREGADDARRPR